jgi:hypothetical protein
LAGIFGSTTTYFGNPPSEFGAFSGVQARRNSSLLLLPVEDPNPYDKRYSSQELADLKQQIREKLAEQAELRRNFQRDGGTDSARTALQQRLRLANELSVLSAKLAIVDDQGNPRSYCMGVQDHQRPQAARVLARGEIDQPGQVVPRGFPSVLTNGDQKIGDDGSGRRELAAWIATEDNPLTARVMVNRIWHSMIGQGIVSTTENFGVTGRAPSHPELLDYLALRFVQSGWSVKAMVREIAASRVYRISSAFDKRAHEYDPDNALLWRANPRRLDAEAIRDAMLLVSGELDLERPRGSEVAKAGYVRVRDGILGDPREMARQAMSAMMAERVRRARQEFRPGLQAGRPFGGRPGFGGPTGRFGPRQQAAPNFLRNRMRAGQQPGVMGMRPPADVYRQIASKVIHALDMVDAKFRSVYLPIVRDEVPRSLDVFDFPNASIVTGARESSNTANQALYLMNNPFVIQQSEAFATRLQKETSQLADQFALAFVLAYGRQPTSGERAATAEFVRNTGLGDDAKQRAEKLSAFCQSLFASAEFRYVD